MKMRIGALVIASMLPCIGVAQVPDSVVWARLDSMSMCPTVSVQIDPTAPIHLASIDMTPIYHRLDSGDLALGFAGVVSDLATLGMVHFMWMGPGPRYSSAHDIVIVGDDSIRVVVESQYDDRSFPSGTHTETIHGTVSADALNRLATSKHITLTLGSESYPLSLGQLQALQVLARQLKGRPVSGEVATGCIGPQPSELDIKWRIARGFGDTVVVRRGAPPPRSVPALPYSTSQTVYTAAQVDKPVRGLDGNPVSDSLPTAVVAAMGGEALFEFVVNADGNVDQSTVRLIRTNHSELAEALVKGFGNGIYFLPAELHGETVRQLVRYDMPVRPPQSP